MASSTIRKASNITSSNTSYLDGKKSLFILNSYNEWLPIGQCSEQYIYILNSRELWHNFLLLAKWILFAVLLYLGYIFFLSPKISFFFSFYHPRPKLKFALLLPHCNTVTYHAVVTISYCPNYYTSLCVIKPSKKVLSQFLSIDTRLLLSYFCALPLLPFCSSVKPT